MAGQEDLVVSGPISCTTADGHAWGLEERASFDNGDGRAAHHQCLSIFG